MGCGALYLVRREGKKIGRGVRCTAAYSIEMDLFIAKSAASRGSIPRIPISFCDCCFYRFCLLSSLNLDKAGPDS
jgi:hypothetical protein